MTFHPNEEDGGGEPRSSGGATMPEREGREYHGRRSHSRRSREPRFSFSVSFCSTPPCRFFFSLAYSVLTWLCSVDLERRFWFTF